jgi:hypothetical protein
MDGWRGELALVRGAQVCSDVSPVHDAIWLPSLDHVSSSARADDLARACRPDPDIFAVAYGSSEAGRAAVR